MGEVDQILKRHNFKADMIFNADETMIAPGKRRVKVVTRGGDPRPCLPEHAKGEHVTLLLTISAGGFPLKPLVIYPLKTLPDVDPELHTKFDFTGTDSGWMTRDLFWQWLSKDFVAQVAVTRATKGYPPTEPALLFVDGPEVHKGLDFDSLWRDHNILVHFLLSHSSTILQPLDLNTKGVLKEHLSKLFLHIPHESAQDRRNRQLHDVSLALSSACCELHIRTGWRRSGLFPFDPQVPLSSPMVVEQAIPRPAPKPVKGKKRLAMHSGTIISNGVPLPSFSSSDSSSIVNSVISIPKRSKFEVVSNDGNVITIQLS